MIIALMVSQVLSWCLIAALVVTCLALARQIGVLYERVAPAGALTGRQGPAAGERAPDMPLLSVTGAAVAIGGPSSGRRLLLFVGPSCPICKKLIPLARRVAKAEGLDLILATDAGHDEVAAMIDRERLADLELVNSHELGLAYAVDKLPHAVLISSQGTIIARGLANTREHLESLVVAGELGVSSVQDFLRQDVGKRLPAYTSAT